MEIGICKVCGKRFNKYRSFQVYCSDNCRNKVLGRARKYNKTKVRKKICPVCDVEFETNLKHKTFCSHECYLKAREDYYVPNKPKQLVCPICEKSFETTHAGQKYCSRECYLEAAERRRNERLKQG